MADQTAELDVVSGSDAGHELVSSFWTALAEAAAAGGAAGNSSVVASANVRAVTALLHAGIPGLEAAMEAAARGDTGALPAWVASLAAACAADADLRGAFLVSGLVAARAAMAGLPFRRASLSMDVGGSSGADTSPALVAAAGAGAESDAGVAVDLMRFYVTAYTAAVAEFGADGVMRLVGELESAASGGAAVDLAVMFRAMAEVGVVGGVDVDLGGEVWHCWALTGRRFDASVYSGFAFNSFCRFQGQVFAAKEDGVYLVAGDTDAGGAITAGVAWGPTHLGTLRKKRLRKAHFGEVGVAPALRVQTDNGERVYALHPANHGGASITRMLVGKEWTVEVQGVEMVEFVDLVPVVLEW